MIHFEEPCLLYKRNSSLPKSLNINANGVINIKYIMPRTTGLTIRLSNKPNLNHIKFNGANNLGIVKDIKMANAVKLEVCVK